MTRFHVHRLKAGDGLVMDLQADLLDGLESRVVAPLIAVEQIGQAFVRLSPRLEIDGRCYIVAVPSMAAIPRQVVGDSIADFSARRDELIAAVDFLFQGF